MRQGYQAAINQFPHDLMDFMSRTQAFRETVAGYATDCRILKQGSYEADAARYVKSILAPGKGGLPTIRAKIFDVVRRRGFFSSLEIALNLVRMLLAERRFGARRARR